MKTNKTSCSRFLLFLLPIGTASAFQHAKLYNNLYRKYQKSSSTLFSSSLDDGILEETDDDNLFLSLWNQKRKEKITEMKITSPQVDILPEEIPILLMEALKNENTTNTNHSGLLLMWEFTTETTKQIFKNNITDYMDSCIQTSIEFPTSFYGVAMYGKHYEMETSINYVGDPSSCWIATQVMKTISSDGRIRRWQWEFRKNKRPPCLGCWKVEQIGSSDRKGNFEPE